MTPESDPLPAPPGGAVPVRASDAPTRVPGTRTRSGNAMGRTRAALLAAAADRVAEVGVRRLTMGDLARGSGVAKATLYNHFRTKDDVLAALLEAEVARTTAGCLAQPDLPAALAHAAGQVCSSAPLRRLAADEPAVLGALLQAGDGPAWGAARAGIAAVLGQAGVPAGPAAVGLVLRWLLGCALAPQEAPGAHLVAAALLAAPDAAPPEPVERDVPVPTGPGAVVEVPQQPRGRAVSDLGWPG